MTDSDATDLEVTGPGLTVTTSDTDRRRIRESIARTLTYRENWIRLGALMIGLVTGIALTLLTNTWAWPIFDDPVAEHTEIVVLAGQDRTGVRQQRIDAWNEMAKEWNKDEKNAGRRKPLAKVVWLPSSSGEQLAEMLRRAQSPAADVDVFVLDAPWTKQFAMRGYIRRLGSDVDATGFLDAPLRTCRIGDGLYALPFNTDAGLLFSWGPPAPADAAGQAAQGPQSPQGPQNWEELRATSRTVKGKAAFVGQFGPGEAFVVNVLEGVLARGGPILDKDGNLNLQDENVRKALRSLSKDLADSTVMYRKSKELDEASSREAFVKRDAVYLRDWPYFVPRTEDGLPDPQVAVNAMPWKGVLGGQNLAVAGESRRPRAAQELIEWLTSETSQVRLFEDGGFAATRRVLYLDPKITGNTRYGYAKPLLASIEKALPRPSVPDYQLFSKVFENVMRRVLDNGGELGTADIERITAATEGKLLRDSGDASTG